MNSHFKKNKNKKTLQISHGELISRTRKPFGQPFRSYRYSSCQIQNIKYLICSESIKIWQWSKRLSIIHKLILNVNYNWGEKKNQKKKKLGNLNSSAVYKGDTT